MTSSNPMIRRVLSNTEEANMLIRILFWTRITDKRFEEGLAHTNNFDGSFSCRGVATLVVGVGSSHFVKAFFPERCYHLITIKRL